MMLTAQMARAWREAQGLSRQQVVDAIVRGTCHNPTDLSQELKCRVCNRQGVVVAITPLGDEYDNGVERYSASVAAVCTSSRQHLRCPYLVLLFSFGSLKVTSPAFQLISRKKRVGAKRVLTQSVVTNNACTASLALTVQRKVPAPRGIFLPPVFVDVAILRHSCDFSLRMLMDNLMLSAHVKIPGEAHRKFTAVMCKPPIPGTQAQNDTSDAWNWCIISVYATPHTMHLAHQVLAAFMRNTAPVRNAQNMDLVAAGLTSLLGNFQNW
eukprot:TRINITY_DN5987_c0_g1_i1.p1 TRINITY_DN5987_c0_g1~~TRINITY_DN5987_c0_g1_i1.p1  ORF type:complete len:313 (+),score=62.23 TRINITY_DN5987_c0_g1_i1:138-941(+)